MAEDNGGRIWDKPSAGNANSGHPVIRVDNVCQEEHRPLSSLSWGTWVEVRFNPPVATQVRCRRGCDHRWARGGAAHELQGNGWVNPGDSVSQGIRVCQRFERQDTLLHDDSCESCQWLLSFKLAVRAHSRSLVWKTVFNLKALAS